MCPGSSLPSAIQPPPPQYCLLQATQLTSASTRPAYIHKLLYYDLRASQGHNIPHQACLQLHTIPVANLCSVITLSWRTAASIPCTRADLLLRHGLLPPSTISLQQSQCSCVIFLATRQTSTLMNTALGHEVLTLFAHCSHFLCTALP